MSEIGHLRRFARLPITSGLLLTLDIIRSSLSWSPVLKPAGQIAEIFRCRRATKWLLLYA
jgi:hypothetical protein